jgi:hypothetical protein
MRNYLPHQYSSRPAPKSSPRNQRGVTMLELIGIVGALMTLVIALNYKTADFFAKSQSLDSDAVLRMADNQLRQYIVANGRLPCPDLTGNGIAATSCDSRQQKGYLPYITLGMADKNYVFGEVPMLYGAYNDGTVAMTSKAQTFYPSYADNSNTQQQVTTTRNIFDFCKSLTDLKALSGATSGVAVTNGSDLYKAVYALAMPGQANRDGLPAGWASGPAVNAQYDGLNATSSNQFALPQSAITPIYDDRTQFRDASNLYDYFRCDAMNSSISLMVEAVSVQKETEDFADSNAETVQKGLIMNAVGIAMAAWQLGQAIAETSAASEVLGISSGLLATVSATCPIPPWVTCALIPVYAVAVGSASTGLGLAAGAIAAAAVELGLQITATVLYADLNSRTSTTPAPVAQTTNVSAARLSELQAAYQTSNATAQTAYNATQPAPAQTVEYYDSLQKNKSAAVTTALNGIVDSTLSTLLKDTFTGKNATCALATTTLCSSNGYTLHGTSGTAFDIVGNYTKELLSAPYSPGVVNAQSGFYQALAMAGTGQATPDPAAALTSSNAVISSYNRLLAATADFDQKNLALANNSIPDDVATLSTARSASLTTLRGLMGNANWDYNGTTTLCGGGGSVSSCGWMTNTSSDTGSTASTTVNDYLTAYANYQNRVNYQKTVDAATGKANSAWSDRNGYKTALCGNPPTSVTWLGGSTLPSANPTNWDASENLLAATPTGLSCTGSAAPLNLSTQNAEANAAEKAKYCVGGSAPDANLCALYSGTATVTRSTIQGAQPIVNALILKGIVK